MILLYALGPLELTEEGRPLLAGRRKPLGLLTYLARRGARGASRAELGELLWGGVEDALARKSLRQALSELRPPLGARLITLDDRVRLDASDLRLDVATFEANVADGRWSDAIGCWRGELLAGLDDLGDDSWRSWVEAERAALRRQLAIALEGAIADAEGRGDWSAAIACASRWRDLLPDDEQGCIRLVTSLRSAGRGAEAAARMAECGKRFQREGTPVSPAFAMLERAIARSLDRGDHQRDGDPLVGARAFLSPDLVGRAGVFEEITRAWDAARDGAGRVVLIDADDGLGKSGLCAEVARYLRARRPAPLVVEARAFESERAHPYSVLRPLIIDLAAGRGAAASPPEILSALARLAPALHERFRHLPDGGPVHETDDAFARLLGDVAAESSVCLLIDDAPDADEESTAVIGALVRRPPPHTLVVLAGRTAAWRASGLNDDVRRASSHLVRVQLAPLTETQTLAMLSSMAPLTAEGGTAIAARLHEASGGNPGQLAVMFAQLADSGAIAPDASGRWQATLSIGELPIALPAIEREAFRARLDRLDAGARRVIEAAAVIGPRVDAELLERVADLRSSAEFESALGALVTARILRQSSGGRGGYEFASEATRLATSELVAPSRGRAWHRAAYRTMRADATRFDPATMAAHKRLGGVAPFFRRPAAIVGALMSLLLVASALAWSRAHAARIPLGGQVLLADVQNLTGDPLFDRSLYAAATVGLQQSHQLPLFPRSRVAESVVRMERPHADSILTEELAREVAEREGVSRIIVLAIAQYDSAYELSARIVEPSSGRDLATERVRVAGRHNVLSGLDGLLSRVRGALGETSASDGATRQPLPRMTTSSLEALRAYAAGQQASGVRHWDLARDEFRSAVALDTSFAMAFLALADLEFVWYNDRAAGKQYLDRALAHMDHLTAREQLNLRAKAASYGGAPAAALQLYAQLAEAYPSRETWMTLGTRLMRERRCGNAIPAFRRALSFDSLYASAYINLATCDQVLRDYRGAVVEYERAQRVDSTALVAGNINHEYGQALIHLGLLDSAESTFRRMLTRLSQEEQGFGHRSLAYLSMYRGRYRAGEAHLDSAIALAQDAGAHLSEYRNDVILAQAAMTSGDMNRARRALDAAWTARTAASLDPAFSMFGGLAFARGGQLPRARTMLDSIRARATPSVADRTVESLLAARIALSAGRAREARALLEQARDTTRDAHRLALYADSYVALGFIDSALVAAVRLSQDMQLGHEQQEEWLHASLRVGRLAVQTGDTARGVAAYRELLSRWREGDGDLPDVREARLALGRLTAANAPRGKVARERKLAAGDAISGR
ncbi:MAG: AAA family ATPase [bacterium]